MSKITTIKLEMKKKRDSFTKHHLAHASTPPVILDACASGLSALPEERENEDYGK